jgi:hypothetical protein
MSILLRRLLGMLYTKPIRDITVLEEKAPKKLG